MRSALPTVMAIALAVFLFGCSVNLEKAVVGRYRAEVDLSGVSESMMKQAQQAAALLNGVALEVKENHRVQMQFVGRKLEGAWKIQDGLLHVDVEQGAKFPAFEIRDGGKRLVPVFEEDDVKRMAGARIWFKRE